MATKIINVTLPENLESLGRYAFSGSKIIIQGNTLPSKLTTIPQYCFQNSLQNETFTIPSNIKTIQYYGFYGCNVSTYNLPNGLESIGGYSFASNGNLSTLVLPDSCQSIGSYAFASSGIQEIVLPKNLEYLQEYTFTNCTSLKYLKIRDTSGNETDPSIDGNTLPPYISSIGSYCFNHCSSLEKITIPMSVKYIYSYAFYQSGIRELKFESPIPPTAYSSDTFYGMNSLEKIYIPAGCVEAYREKGNYSTLMSKVNNGSVSLIEYQLPEVTYSFVTTGGTSVESQTTSILQEAPVTEASNQDEIFLGWYLDSEFERDVEFPFFAKENTTLYALYGAPDGKNRNRAFIYKNGNSKTYNGFITYKNEIFSTSWNSYSLVMKIIPEKSGYYYIWGSNNYTTSGIALYHLENNQLKQITYTTNSTNHVLIAGETYYAASFLWGYSGLPGDGIPASIGIQLYSDYSRKIKAKSFSVTNDSDSDIYIFGFTQNNSGNYEMRKIATIASYGGSTTDPISQDWLTQNNFSDIYSNDDNNILLGIFSTSSSSNSIRNSITNPSTGETTHGYDSAMYYMNSNSLYYPSDSNWFYSSAYLNNSSYIPNDCYYPSDVDPDSTTGEYKDTLEPFFIYELTSDNEDNDIALTIEYNGGES